MTNEEILKKAIEKARKNGWKQATYYIELYLRYENSPALLEPYWRKFIFSHDFAKAFAIYLLKEREQQARKLLGIEYMPYINIEIERHSDLLKEILLTQMVLEKEPLKYLEKFLK